MTLLEQVQNSVGKLSIGVYTNLQTQGALSYATTYTRTKHLALEMVKGDYITKTQRNTSIEGEKGASHHCWRSFAKEQLSACK
jgi:hypothetical protein